MMNINRFLCALVLWLPSLAVAAQPQNHYRAAGHIYLDTSNGYRWQMKKAADVALSGSELSQPHSFSPPQGGAGGGTLLLRGWNIPTRTMKHKFK